MSAGAGQNVEASYPKFFANSAAAAKQWKLLWLGVGDADFALNGTKALDEVLTKHGVKHPLTIRPGYRHEWRCGAWISGSSRRCSSRRERRARNST